MVTTLKIHADVNLDLTGLTCPAPLLGAKQIVDDLKPGRVLALVSDCPGTRDDLYIWARHTGNEIAHVEHQGGNHRVFYIRKGRKHPLRAQVTLDMRGAVCPGPILEARRVLEGMKPGEVLRLITSCPAARDEVKTWTRATHQQLVDMREIGAGEWEFLLRRAAIG
ncbi:MAG: sulfurtransferase TusA family protein [Betaproteobacteria bacterium]|nr:sulfurtransferase TusA family protein [Betaproteobacteria bacterium]